MFTVGAMRGTAMASVKAGAAVPMAAVPVAAVPMAAVPVAEADAGTAVDPDQDAEVVAEDDAPWVTIVWNDPVNLMSYVTYVFETLLGHPRPMAEKLMLDVHQKGRATVAHGTRESMEATVTRLHGAGLWATMAQDR